MTFHQDIGFQPPPPPNPGSILPTIQSMREIQGQNALGAAYQQAVDPTTGRIDQARFVNALTASNAPWMVGPGGIQAGQSMQAQGAGTQEQLAAQRQQLQFFNSTLAGIDLSVPHYAPELQTKLDALNKSGYITPAAYAQGTQMLKTLGPNEPANDLIRSMRYMGQSAEEFANRNLPPTVGQQMEMQKWLQQPYTWNDSTTGGVPYQGTYGEFLQRHNVPASQFFPGGVGGGAGGGGGPGPVTSRVGSGRQTGDGTGGGAGGGGGGTPGPTNIGTPTQAYDPAVLKAGTDAYNSDAALQKSLGTRLYPVTSAISLLHSDPSLATGPGQQSFARVVTGISQSLGLPVPLQASNFQELGKYLATYMSNLPGANRSDLGSLEAEARSPNPTMSRPAIEQLLARAVGFERLRGAGYDYFNQQYKGGSMEAGLHAGTYAMSTSGWHGAQDPVAWSADYMTPDQVKSYFNGLSGKVTTDKNGQVTGGTGDKYRFILSRNAAQTVGGIRMGASAPAAPPPIFKPAPNEQQPAVVPPAVAPPAAAPINPNIPAPPAPGTFMSPKEMYGG